MTRVSWECSANTNGTCLHCEWICRDLFALGGSLHRLHPIHSIHSAIIPSRLQSTDLLSAVPSCRGVAAALLGCYWLLGSAPAGHAQRDFHVGSGWSQWWSAKAVSVQTWGCVKAATQSSACLSQPCSCSTAAQLPSVTGTACWGLLT